MFDRPKSNEQAILVQINFPEITDESDLDEFTELARAAKANILGFITGTRRIPDAKYFIGAGKAEEIREQVQVLKADLVLVNHELSPSQERNLEKLLQCRVVDRSGLILDIFAQRARSFEGRLQVELAQLEYIATRLIRGWTHLERQKGGIGLRGPGETQLETDRRLIKQRMQAINKRLEKVRNNRAQNRKGRRKSGVCTVSLVGYTNAGKSSLFNALTAANIYEADQLFATLDPTMRRLDLPGTPGAILVDTVGFVRNLPHHLIKAFLATLEETKEADLLLHVIDISNSNWRENIKAVEQVLNKIGLPPTTQLIQVFNKIDAIPMETKMNYNRCKVWVSAKSGAGLEYLREAITTKLFGELLEKEITLANDQNKLRSELYSLKAVISETRLPDGGWILKVKLSKKQLENFNINV